MRFYSGHKTIRNEDQDEYENTNCHDGENDQCVRIVKETVPREPLFRLANRLDRQCSSLGAYKWDETHPLVVMVVNAVPSPEENVSKDPH